MSSSVWKVAGPVGLAALIAVGAAGEAAAAKKPAVRISGTTAGGACGIDVRVSRAPKGSVLLLQRRAKKRWTTIRTRPAALRQTLTCAKTPRSSVRVVLQKDGRTLAQSRTMKQPVARVPRTTPPPVPVPVPDPDPGKPVVTTPTVPSDPSVPPPPGTAVETPVTIVPTPVPADTTPPETTLHSTPERLVNRSSADLTYSGTTGDTARFECRRDDGAFAACPDYGITLTDLDDGDHAFEVRAVDAAGNADPSPARTAWSVDTVAPDTSLDDGPAALIAADTATFAYSADGADELVRFECRTDAADWARCPAGRRVLEGVEDGAHRFEVRAVDAAGNADATPAERAWTVDLTAPVTTISAGPAARIAERTATLAYETPAEDLDRFECAIGDGDFAPCAASGLTLTELDHGRHRVRVRAVDRLGNVERTPADRAFFVDLRAPDTVLPISPPEIIAGSTAVFSWGAVPTAAGDRFECRLDEEPFATCAGTELTTPALQDGEHRFAVRAVDEVGNTDPTPVEHRFAVDTTAPDTAIDRGPQESGPARTARFGYSSADDSARFECAVDGGAFDRCGTDGFALSDVAAGEHTLAVRAVDDVGNADATPAERTWTVVIPESPDAPELQSTIAELFPTVLRDALPSEGQEPRLGTLTRNGFQIRDGATGTVGSTLSEGSRVTDGDVTLTVTPQGDSQSTGVVKDDAVIYDAGVLDHAVRPTGDKGLEVLSLLPEGTTRATYDVGIPAGAELVELDNGDIAIVDPEGTPDADIAKVGSEIDEAEDEVVAAAVESAADAADEAEGHDELATSFEELAEAPAVPVSPVIPSHAQMQDENGEIPAFADPDATLEQVEAAADEAERAIDLDDVPAADKALVAEAEAFAGKAEGLAEDVRRIEDLAIESAASDALNGRTDAVLAEQLVADAEESAAVALDIGDSGAEQLRAAAKAVDAQRQVEGRVVGLMSAPMAKDEDALPVVSTLEIVDANTVAVVIPPDIESDVVADPFIIPVAFFVARVVVQRVAPIVVRAAIQGAKQIISKAGSAATKVGQQVAKVVRQANTVVRNAASHAGQAASRAAAALRGAAATAANSAASQAARAAAERARQIAAQQIAKAQEAGRQALAKVIEAGRVARVEELARRADAARRAAIAAKDAIVAATNRVVQTVRAARDAMQIAKTKIGALLKARFGRIGKLLKDEAARHARDGIDLAVEKVLEETVDDERVTKCVSPPVSDFLGDRLGLPERRGALSYAFVANDVAKCLGALFADATVYAPGSPPTPDPGPSPEEIRQIILDSYAEAERNGNATLANFTPPPPSAPARQARVISTTVPPYVAAEQPGYFQIAAINEGQRLSLSHTHVAVDGGGVPWIQSGHVGGQPTRLALTDENADGVWDHGEVVNAVFEVRPPKMRSASASFTFGFVSDDVGFSGGHGMTVNVQGPRETLRLSNLVTNGPVHMREDGTPIRLTTQPWTYCTRRGCNIGGTERGSGGTYDHAVCWTSGERTTNGDDTDASDDHNPQRYDSAEYYGVELNGTFGYVSWVWVHPVDRGGLDLPAC